MGLPHSSKAADHLIRRMCAHIANKYGDAGAYNIPVGSSPEATACVHLAVIGHMSEVAIHFEGVQKDYFVLAAKYPDLKISKARFAILEILRLYASIARLLK